MFLCVVFFMERSPFACGVADAFLDVSVDGLMALRDSYIFSNDGSVAVTDMIDGLARAIVCLESEDRFALFHLAAYREGYSFYQPK